MESIILKTYKRDRDSEFATSMTRVVDGLTDNPDLIDPPPAYEALKTLLPDYRTAIANAKGRHSVAVSRKKDLKAKGIGYMTELDAWVTEKCKGDRTMLLSSGFYVSGEKGNETTQSIGELEVQLGAPGFVTTRIKRIRGTRAYLHQVASELPTSATLWTNEASPNPSFTFSGLTSGKNFWLRIAIMSSTGKMLYSS
ncbi:MAG TPA: hypothetical protein VGE79_16100, partial [Niastella sp.]